MEKIQKMEGKLECATSHSISKGKSSYMPNGIRVIKIFTYVAIMSAFLIS